ncbi:MAG: deoxyuridine 5'-triphosphate nucleotidohydrolase [Lachnospiraceae bacterium]|nr:deoxyuridine 5'-triphosphate nucleotidohydrolase [Lachnospiraceae bacterium]
MNIKIVYHTDKIDRLKYVDGKSDWIDLRASERVEFKKGEWKLIPLGISMELPAGYEAHVVPRSSTFKNWGLIQTNSMGVIDNSYCATDDMWMVPMLATRDTVVEINDRICQMRIMENQPTIEFVEVDSLPGRSRGGFGSTGKN